MSEDLPEKPNNTGKSSIDVSLPSVPLRDGQKKVHQIARKPQLEGQFQKVEKYAVSDDPPEMVNHHSQHIFACEFFTVLLAFGSDQFVQRLGDVDRAVLILYIFKLALLEGRVTLYLCIFTDVVFDFEEVGESMEEQ